MKRLVGWLMGLLMLASMIPGGGRLAQAFDPQNYRIDTVTIFKIYNAERQLEERRVLITGQYLKDATVGIITSTGYQELTSRLNNSEGLLQFNISQDQTGSYLVVEGMSIAINEGAMPTLTGVNRKVRIGVDDLLLQGTNLTAVQNEDGISAGYEHEGAYTPMDKSAFDDNTQVVIPQPSGALGLQNIIFEKADSATYQFQPGVFSDVVVNIKYTYQEQFRFVQDIVINDLEMYPNRGEPGSKLIFQAPHANLNIYDVFFLKSIDGTDPYSSAKKGKNRTFQSDVNGMDILTVEVPDLDVGEYYVVLTNPVTSGSDPSKQVVQELIVGDPDYEWFTIIDSNIKSVILNVQPSYGPDTGSRVTVAGQFFGTLNIPEFVPYNNSITLPDPPVNTKELLLTYAEGTYRSQHIKAAQRTIKVIVGDQATFMPNAAGSAYEVSFNSDLDNLTVMTAQVSDANTDPRKDVVVETQTTLVRDDDSTIIFKERAALDDGYTYVPSKIAPQIGSIIPAKIQVVGSAGSYSTPEDRLIAVYGSNFAVTRFVNDDGQEIVRYPIISLGPELVLDKNADATLDLNVYDENGREVDGTEGHDSGTKILATIPAASSINTLGKNYLKVTNPVKNSENPGLSAQRNDFIEFVNPDSSRVPVITSVTPDVVTVDGGDNVVIQGSNFMSGVKVYINGAEVSGIVRQGDGKQITLVAPAGQEGETQLQVMNPEGGMDTSIFTYVLTYTNPKITSFAPKSGNTGTLVMVKGENFLKPEPAANESSILQLIGTRILLEGQEVNEYNRNASTGKIEMRPYSITDQDPLLEIATNEAGGLYLELADYSQAVILDDEGAAQGGLYTLEQDYSGDIILTNGSDHTYEMELSADGSQILAVKSDGTSAVVSVQDDRMDIDESTPLTLMMNTLYRVDTSNNIVGKRVKVLDSGELLFTVPILEADGYYDLTVINPDTKRDSRVDQLGFYYYKLPLSKPTIDSIEPSQGSTQGGYSIDITGSEYEDNGNSKTRVYINGIEVSAADTQVSTTGDTVAIKVPAYPGDLRTDKGTDHLTVPVVLVNPDGGTASREDGFTYVIPASHPKITSLVPIKGSAAGSQVVEIKGTDFRYFEPYDDANRNQIWDTDESYSDINRNGRWDSEDDLDEEEWDWREPIEIDHSQYEVYYASPILPRIYFGKKLAKIVEFDRGYIKVLTPAGSAGVVDVFLVNNDAGMSNAVRYTYESSSPKITSIIPDLGPKQGQQRAEINGTGFAAQNLTILQGDDLIETTMPLVRFGSIDNTTIPREQDNSGRIDSGTASVSLDGGLMVDYRASGTLTVLIEERGQVYQHTYAYDDSTRYIDTRYLTLSGDDSISYEGYELIKVSVQDRRLMVERGFSPETELIRSSQISLKTPSYHTVGMVTVRILNPDGAQATGQYEYKNPDSRPVITSITRDGRAPESVVIEGETFRVVKMDYRAQSVVSVLGEDFREDAQIQIGDLFTVEPQSIRYELPGKLTFTMPQVPQTAIGDLQRVVVINIDGGTASSDEIPGAISIYLQFSSGETTPSISGVTPGRGPVSGGTVAIIQGSDFRQTIDGFDGEMAVYFGDVDVPAENIEIIDYKTVRVVTPAGSPGAVDVRVENPDGVFSTFAEGFTYISTPTISAVLDPSDAAEETRINRVSILGGQQIKIKGSGFMTGARVFFNPVVADVGTTASQGTEILRITTQVVEGVSSKEITAEYLESGDAASSVVIVDSETLLVTTPSGKVGSGGFLVVNPDNGASDDYGLPFDLPELAAPGGVVAEIVRDEYADCDRFIKVHWTPVQGATEYEVYVLEDDENQFIGSTRLTAYIFQDLKPNTRYQFIVKAVGDYGSSPPSMESNRLKTGDEAGRPDDDGKPGEKSSIVRAGLVAYYNIGSEDNPETWTLDLTRGDLAGVQEVVVTIPAAAVAYKSGKEIDIRGLDYEIKLSPAVFNLASVADYADQDNAGIRFRIAPAQVGAGISSTNSLSKYYSLEAHFYIGAQTVPLDLLAGQALIYMAYDENKAQLRRLNQTTLARFNSASGTWDAISASSGSGWCPINRMGVYTVIGSRR